MSQGSANFMLEVRNSPNSKKTCNSFRFGEFQRRTSRRIESNHIEPYRTRISSNLKQISNEFQVLSFRRLPRSTVLSAVPTFQGVLPTPESTALISQVPTPFSLMYQATATPFALFATAVCNSRPRSTLCSKFQTSTHRLESMILFLLNEEII